MIYCVWYPSGGFGHFVNSILNLYGKNFCRPKNSLSFSSDGNSHSLDYVAPSYIKNQKNYSFNFDPSSNYSIIVDNGIDNQEENFRKFFPDAVIIKMCYSDYSWPVIAHTMITKAMKSNFDQELKIDATWNCRNSWAQREKYFLFLRDHKFRHMWKPSDFSFNIYVEDLFDYHTMVDKFSCAKIELENFQSLHQQWYCRNQQYINPVITANAFVNGIDFDTPILDIWTQAVVYYQIWCKYQIEVPYNEFSNFFVDQQQYLDWIKSNK